MLKIKPSALSSLILGVMLHGGSFAENADSIYNYQPANPQVDPYSGYRWRPSGNAQRQFDSEVTRYRSGSESAPGRVQSPMAQPPGAYRPFKQQKTIIPQVGDFRFRALSPEAQSGSEKINTSQSGIKSDRYTARPKFRNYDNKQSFGSTDVEQKFRFRPDQGFSSSRGEKDSMYMNNPSQAYPPIYSTPVFRQDNRLR